MYTNKKIVRLFCEYLKRELNMKSEEIGDHLKFSGQTIRNWLHEKNEIKQPQELCESIALCYKNQFFPYDFSDGLLKYFEDNEIFLPHYIKEKYNLEEIMRYLLLSDESKKLNQTTYKVLNLLRKNSLLPTIMEKKIRLNAERYPFFRVGFVDQTSVTLNFLDLNQEYTYKVRLFFLCDEDETDNIFSAQTLQIHQKIRQNNAHMMIYFTLFCEDENTIYSNMQNNIYIDKIDVDEIKNCKSGKDFVYDSTTDPKELLLANVYADRILAHLSKYYTVINKNLLFHNTQNKPLDPNNKWAFWNPKAMEQSEIEFEATLWHSILHTQKKDILIIVGLHSFPLIAELQCYFRRIICLDNSQECISFYTHFQENNTSEQENKCNIEFFTFTSILSHLVTNQLGLRGAADAVIYGVGSSSLFRSIEHYVKFTNIWLKPEGIACFSFFNERFLYDYHSRYDLTQQSTYIPLPNQQRALVANRNTQTLSVSNYYVYCKLYDNVSAGKTLGKFFEITNYYSYPFLINPDSTTPSILGNIFRIYDQEYSKTGHLPNNEVHFNSLRGFYLTTFVQKKFGVSPIIPKLEIYNFCISGKNKKMVIKLKTVLLKSKKIEDKTCYVALLERDNKLPQSSNGSIVLLNEFFSLQTIKEINQLGFEIGCIPPFFTFSSEHGHNIQFFQCFELPEESESLYSIESNEYNKPIILNIDDLKKLINEYHYYYCPI